MVLTLLLAPDVCLSFSYHLSLCVSPLLLLWIKVTDGRTSRWLCFMGWEDPREKCFHFPERLCALLHDALSRVLSPFVSHVSFSLPLSLSPCQNRWSIFYVFFQLLQPWGSITIKLICHALEQTSSVRGTFSNLWTVLLCNLVTQRVSGPVNTVHLILSSIRRV